MKKLLLAIFVLLFTISPVLAQNCKPVDTFIQEFEYNFPSSVRYVMTDEQLNNFNQEVVAVFSNFVSDFGIWWTHPDENTVVYVATSISGCVLADGTYNKEKFYENIKRETS